MKKAEAERKVRYFIGEWAKEKGYKQTSDEDPSFYEFWNWMKVRYPQALDFRSTGGAMYTVQRWFDYEMNQHWKN